MTKPFCRDLWIRRTRWASTYVSRGDLHLAALVLSWVVILISLSLSYLRRWCKPKSRASPDVPGDNPEILVSIPYAFAHLATSIAACCLSWLHLHHGAGWKRSTMLSYVVFLGLIQYCFRDRTYRSHAYRHMNAMALVAFLLGCVHNFLPMTIVGGTYRPTSIGAALTLCLGAVNAIALATPRPRRAFIPDPETHEPVLTPGVSPEETCSLFSYYCSYEWITHVILRGFRRDLTMDDLPPLPSYDDPSRWLEKIKKQRLKGGKTLRTLCRLLSTEIQTMMTWSAITAVMDFVAPYAMLRLLAYLEEPESVIVQPSIWVALLFVGPMTRSLCYQQYIFTATRLLVRVNISLVQEIYQTAMKSYIYDESVDQSVTNGRSKSSPDKKCSKAEKKSSQANLTSLMSYDVDAIYNSRDIFYVATASPIATALALAFLYRMLGWPSLFGVLTLLILTPLPAMASRRVSRIQQSVMRATDARLAKISEYLSSIRTLKYFGWEHAAMDSINEVRSVEQNRLWQRSVYAAAISMAGDLLPMVSLLVMFTLFVLFTGLPLRAPVAFTSLSIMETLRSQFVWLSNVSRFSAQGAESLRRVDRFFDSAAEMKRHPEGPLEMKHATFRRTPIAAFRLQDVSVCFKPRALNVVTGSTGSGKTSLLLSLLGETVLESGSATCPRDVAFVPQAPWLRNDTIRQNILFYSPFDQGRYNAVVEASGLTQDLEQLPAGDLTLVGEKGTSLSGGQKQRVSLARALYSSSPTLLLDDIFSALDTHTTTLVYEKCFRSGFLSDRTVVLVTHFPPALQEADLVIRMKHGRVVPMRVFANPQQDALQFSPCSTPGTDSDSSIFGNAQMIDHCASPVDPAAPIPPAIHDRQDAKAGRIVQEKSATGRVPRTLCKMPYDCFREEPILTAFSLPVYAPVWWAVLCAHCYLGYRRSSVRLFCHHLLAVDLDWSL